MNAMGVSSYKQLLAKEKKSTDQKMIRTMTEIGNRIARASGANYNWEFTLIDSPTVNAFCLPGGKIGVYTGILKIAENNAGLAAIMGHEVAHATARHSNERVSQQLVFSGGLMALDSALKNDKKKNLIMAAIGLGAQFGVLLPYSRRQESEADTIGLKYMARAGYDPREASTLWLRMAKLGKSPPEWLSTHPNPETRSRKLAVEANDYMALFNRSEKQVTAKL